jgi:hypothetical protein
MLSRDNQGEVVGEINNSFTDNGDRVVTNTMYYRGNPVFQHITIRDNEGKVRTTNVIGGKLLPWSRSPKAEVPREKRREQDMQIGKMLRTIVVEPLELPVKLPTSEPEPEPIQSLEPEPERVPVAQWTLPITYRR